MYPPLRRLFVSLVIVFCFLAPFAEAGTVEMSRTPTVTQPKTSGTRQATPVRSQPQQQRLKKTSPASKIQSGYCCADGKIEKSNAATCKRKRGELFADQRSAQKACDAQSGYCCKEGTVTRSNRGNCKRSRGEFFVKQTDAKQKCSQTKGFCCDKGEVTAGSKGNCDRKKGKFSLKKSAVDSLCAKQKGYCCKDGKVSANTQGACKNQRGSFSLTQKDAEHACAKQNGYCCIGGKVTRMNQGTCKQKKGQFALKQQLAERSCKAEKGFCCKNGKIAGSTRGRCKQVKGDFSVRKTALSKNCTTAKKTIRTNQTAVSVPPTDGKKRSERPIIAKPGVNLGEEEEDIQPKTGSKKLTKPLLNPSQGAKPLEARVLRTQPSQQKINVPATAPSGGNLDHLKSTNQSALNSSLPGAATAILASSGLKSGDVTKAVTLDKATVQQQKMAAAELARLPDSSLIFGVKQPLQVVYIKDRFVRIGSAKDSGGLGSKLGLSSVTANFSCGDISLSDAGIMVTNGHSYQDLTLHLNNGSMNFSPFIIQEQAQFVAAHCQPGKEVKGESTTLKISLNKTCQYTEGGEAKLSSTISLPMTVFCDMRPDADPASYNPQSIQYATIADKTITADIPGQQQAVTGVQDPGELSTSLGPQPTIDLTMKESDASLSLQHNSGLYIGNTLRFGSAYQSVESASPVEMLTSNIELQINCKGLAKLVDADLHIRGGETYLNIHHQVDDTGYAKLNDMSIMRKSGFSSTYCSDGDFYLNEDRGIPFVISYQCSNANGETQSEPLQYQKEIRVPFTMSCDRRQRQKAVATHTPFKHTCPDGFHLVDFPGQLRQNFSPNGPDNPLRCIRTTGN